MDIEVLRMFVSEMVIDKKCHNNKVLALAIFLKRSVSPQILPMKNTPILKSSALVASSLTLLSWTSAIAGSPEVAATPEISESACEDLLLGDMWGLRRPADTGIDFRFEATNFYHGMVDGDRGRLNGNDDSMVFSGKLDFFMDIDGQKAGLWPGLFIKVHGEYRYGDTTNLGGVLSPVNVAMLAPAEEGEAFAFTNITVTQALSESFLVTAGKFNTVDLVDKLYYGGQGMSRFMNASLTVMPIAGRTFPISTLGAVGTVLQDGKPFVNFGVLDSISPTTSAGFDGLSSDEMTLFADITFRTDWDGRPGTHTLAGSFSTIDATSLDQSDILRPPNVGGATPNVAGDSWQINYMWEQSLTRNPSAPGQGWGSFLFLALSDADPNPISYSAAVGLVSNGVGSSRPCDSFGIGLFYNGVSGELKDSVSFSALPNRGINLGDEFGAEIYYDFAVTDGFRVTADLQIIDPIDEDNGAAIFAGLRTRFIF